MMDYFKRNGTAILVGLIELLVGILLLINPIRFTSGILIGIGIFLVIWGIAYLVRYFRTEATLAALEQDLAKGLIMLLLGVFLIFWTERAIAIFPLLTHLYGIIILITGVLKFQQSVDLLRLKVRYWFLAGLNAVLAVLFAVLILSNPFASTVVLWQVAGISLIVEAILDTVVLIITGK